MHPFDLFFFFFFCLLVGAFSPFTLRKLNIQKTKIIAFTPINLWQIDGETMETMTDFIFLGYKITADGDCSHEIQRHLFLGRIAMTNLSVLKSKHITLWTKVHLVKDMAFPVVMYRCEGWTIKKAEYRIYAFELWYWKRLLRIPWTTRRSNLSILKELNTEYSLEGLMLRLKPQYFGHLMQIANFLGKNLILEKLKAGEGEDTGRDGWMASLTQWT